MLTTFPELLTFSLFTPTLLRFAAGGVLLYVAYMHWIRRDVISKLSFPIIGRTRWIIWLSVAAHIVVGGMLIAGYYTQVAALLGIVWSIKSMIFHSRFEPAFPVSRLPAFLLLMIFISLLFTGAGLFAFDLPL
jgi:hypothetical protein